MELDQFEQIARFGKVRYALGLMTSIMIIGTFSYMYIEDAALIDAMYMTVITISTVGYSETIELSTEGQIFTILLIIVSWIAFAYSISVITSLFVEGGLGGFLVKYRTKNKLKHMKNHVIVVGYGRNGHQTAEELRANGVPYLIIEINHNLIVNSITKDTHFVEGDATEDEVLIEAGIKDAKAIIISLPDDATNVFISMTARSLNQDIFIVSRSSSASTEKKLMIAGANRVVMPERVGGSHMASIVSQPDVVNFLQQISVRGDADTNLVEVTCSNLPGANTNTTIADLDIRKLTGANIIGFKLPDGNFIINPSPDTKLIPNAKLFVLGDHEQIQKMQNILKS